MTLIEGKLGEALSEARLLGVAHEELMEMVLLLWEDEG